MASSAFTNLESRARASSVVIGSGEDAEMWNAIFGSSDLTKHATEVTFKINGRSHKVGSNVAENSSLNTFIREVTHLSGTKFMCNEGGCGACIVAATITHPITKQRQTLAVNSCLVPVLACHGWSITTVEGLGDRRTGYHRVQAQLAHFNGTQCGFCSPGMVMSMYSLLENKTPTMAEVEDAFGGNICRCTGYRPILDAFKALSSDATPELKMACTDIEDLYKICSKTGQQCSGSCSRNEEENDEDNEKINGSIIIKSLGGTRWYKVTSVSELFSTFDAIGDAPYRLMAGNTAEGVYRSATQAEAYIDVKDVIELRTNSTTPSFTVGANVTLTEVIDLFSTSTLPGFAYLKQLAQHIQNIANLPVRNVATIAGNLMIKKSHPLFPSDIYTILETVGATVNIMESGGRVENLSLQSFLSLDMNKKIIINIVLPNLDETYVLKTFKISPRAQNAHAYVNAGFLVKVHDTSSWKVVEKPRIVFGGIHPQFVHASDLETFLNNKGLLDPATVSGALSSLNSELQPDHILPDASPKYRKELAQALFYKFLLSLAPHKVSPAHRSGGENLVRPLSSGSQDFQTDKSLWPLGEPIPKLEAISQCSGEAEYINDIPTYPEEKHAAFVLTKVSQGIIKNIDTDTALKMSGVQAFFSHANIPGENNFTPNDFMFLVDTDEIFCSGEVKYAGQVVGLIVADTRQIALQAANAVTVEYINVKRPVISMDEALQISGDRVKTIDAEYNTTRQKKETTNHVVKGEFEIHRQFHFSLETQTCLVIPKNDGFDVHLSTQWMDIAQTVVARALNIPANNVNVKVRRVGGAYGAKITRPSQLAAACAVASNALNRPVRLVMSLEDNMELVGMRYAVRNNYEVEVDSDGKIQHLNSTFLQDSGCNFNDSPLPKTIRYFKDCYVTDEWVVNGRELRTDTASNTWCRGPGSLEGLSFAETIMEHIAKVVKKDPLEVRLANMLVDDNPLPQMITDLKQKADYDFRKQAVETFNNANRWKKRGIAIATMKYPFMLWGKFNALVSIYHIDGSVAISHGGIEMGQGLNTKCAQVCAHTLGIPLSKVSIKPTNTLTAPNGTVTAGSIGSESCAYATMMACQELLKRLEPVRAGMDNPSWEQLIKAAFDKNVDLCATYMFSDRDKIKNYDIWGVAIGEVEVDILTGEREVVRVDLMEDVGQSMSPQVDVGQVEGAFIMGMGYWLSEELVHDPNTGRLLTNRTWNYKPPGAKDIPADFRVYFRRDAPNIGGVLNSKSTGEPSLCLSIVILYAIRHALDSARKDAGEPEEWYQMKTPATPENIYLMSKTDTISFRL